MNSRGSSHSLLTRRDSEIGSQYVLESGVFMSSFAAAILVASIVTIVVLMLTVLVALSAMLQSCQRSSSGYFEQVQWKDDQFAHCNSFAFHAELNNLEENEYPASCKQHLIQYFEKGLYLREFNFTLSLAESYFRTSRPNDDGLDVVLVDADDIFIPNATSDGNFSSNWGKVVEAQKHQWSMLVLGLLVNLRENGWSLRFFTRNYLGKDGTAAPCFLPTGLGECSPLISRTYDEELLLENWDYISRRRVRLNEEGFRIFSIISCRLDAFQGARLGKRNFKLACPSHHMLGKRKSTDVLPSEGM